MSTSAGSVLRLTAKVLEQVLKLNEGIAWTTSYSTKNFSKSRKYLISGGKLLIRAVRKTSWADSRFDKSWVATADEVIRLLRAVLSRLKLPS